MPLAFTQEDCLVLSSTFFSKKCGFFAVEPPIYLGKHHYSEGFGHKEVKFLSKFVLVSSGKKFDLPLLSIKITPTCTTVHMYLDVTKITN